jgi:hypothetical protein
MYIWWCTLLKRLFNSQLKLLKNMRRNDKDKERLSGNIY